MWEENQYVNMSFLEIKKVKIEVEVALDMLEEQLLRTVNPNV